MLDCNTKEIKREKIGPPPKKNLFFYLQKKRKKFDQKNEYNNLKPSQKNVGPPQKNYFDRKEEKKIL